uniref:Uncharacterized protein n=1 Tax=Rhizophora mucronata TaxID=61149 RepID=A0A2P2NBX8_RHIMU
MTKSFQFLEEPTLNHKIDRNKRHLSKILKSQQSNAVYWKVFNKLFLPFEVKSIYGN